MFIVQNDFSIQQHFVYNFIGSYSDGASLLFSFYKLKFTKCRIKFNKFKSNKTNSVYLFSYRHRTELHWHLKMVRLGSIFFSESHMLMIWNYSLFCIYLLTFSSFFLLCLEPLIRKNFFRVQIIGAWKTNRLTKSIVPTKKHQSLKKNSNYSQYDCYFYFLIRFVVWYCYEWCKIPKGSARGRYAISDDGTLRTNAN